MKVIQSLSVELHRNDYLLTVKTEVDKWVMVPQLKKDKEDPIKSLWRLRGRGNKILMFGLVEGYKPKPGDYEIMTMNPRLYRPLRYAIEIYEWMLVDPKARKKLSDDPFAAIKRALTLMNAPDIIKHAFGHTAPILVRIPYRPRVRRR